MELHSLTIEWMCVCRGGGVNIITDVLYSVTIYIFLYYYFIVYTYMHFEVSHVTDIAL